VAVLFGPYRVFEALGIGGMATVNRAEITIDGAVYEIALKCLDAELARDKIFVRRFIAEARLGQLLKHPNIARTHEIGNVESTHFIAFEYIPGVTVLQIFDAALESRPPPVYITLRIIAHIARALAYAHDLVDEQGRHVELIHRDIAPSNILVADNGAVKLIDFGVAKSTLAHVNTAVGEVIGKLGYVAPEYLRTGKVDVRADIYSLGVIAYELLTGKRLFAVETLEDAEAVRYVELQPPSTLNEQLPSDLDPIILKMLAPDPAKRWQTATELQTEIEEFIDISGLAIHESDIASWVNQVFGAPTRVPQRAKTSDIVMDVEFDIESVFKRVRARTES